MTQIAVGVVGTPETLANAFSRLLIAGLIGVLVLIVWVEAAVGIFH